MRELIATQSCDDLKVSTEQRRDLACRTHVTHRSPLRDRCGQLECPCDRPDAAPYWTGSSEANGAEIDHADRVILVTCE
jgi:hypothetical protein